MFSIDRCHDKLFIMFRISILFDVCYGNLFVFFYEREIRVVK